MGECGLDLERQRSVVEESFSVSTLGRDNSVKYDDYDPSPLKRKVPVLLLVRGDACCSQKKKTIPLLFLRRFAECFSWAFSFFSNSPFSLLFSFF
jgi:hypothetical protein